VKKRLTTLLAFPLFLALESAAFAFCDSFGTGTMDIGNMSQSTCLNTAQIRLTQTGAKITHSSDSTVFAKIGSDRVAITCVANKQLAYYAIFGCNTATLNLIAKEVREYYQ
jgi:hypothetical protein